jgi:hypothetical protein
MALTKKLRFSGGNVTHTRREALRLPIGMAQSASGNELAPHGGLSCLAIACLTKQSD